MPTLTITKSYADATTLTEAQLDDAFDDIKTFVNTTKLDSDNLQIGGVAEASIAAGAVTEAKLGTGAVSTVKLADDAVTAAKLADNAVVTANIVDDAVTAAKVADGAIDATAKLADGIITHAKLVASRPTGTTVAAGGVAMSAISLTTSSTSPVTVTGSSITITTTGRPVVIMAFGGVYTVQSGATNDGQAQVFLYRDGSGIGNAFINEVFSAGTSNAKTQTLPASVIAYIDTPAAGSHTYLLKAQVSNASNSCNLTGNLVAYEL